MRGLDHLVHPPSHAPAEEESGESEARWASTGDGQAMLAKIRRCNNEW